MSVRDDFVKFAERGMKTEGSAKTTARQRFALRLKVLNLYFVHLEKVGGFYV